MGNARLILLSPEGAKTFELSEKITTLGRTPASTIMVDDNACSRKHCMIKKEQDTYSIVDLGSANGILVNGEKVKEQTLHHDDRVKIGQTVLVFKER